jgi:hypothetical protein
LNPLRLKALCSKQDDGSEERKQTFHVCVSLVEVKAPLQRTEYEAVSSINFLFSDAMAEFISAGPVPARE